MISHERFLWGAATAAYQIEGATDQDGRGKSIWDTFSETPGLTRDGDTGAVACDHYHRWADDVALMKELGLKAYRFSIAWPRVVPGGVGPVNPKGVEFYRNLAGALLDAGIEPFATLYHWDAPQAIEDAGGWPKRKTSEAFEEYARVCFRELGDLIPNWMTFNEPRSTSFSGYCNTIAAPGLREPPKAIDASHTIMIAHGLAVRAFRESGRKGQIGIVLDVEPVYPATDLPADIAAAKRVDSYMNHWWLRPIVSGENHEPFSSWAGRCSYRLTNDDLRIASEPMDFLGWNYYTRHIVEEDPDEMLYQAREVRQTGSKYNDMGMEICPSAMSEFLAGTLKDYWKGPIYITENGASFPDCPDADGYVRDYDRLEYIRQHTAEVAKALSAGHDLRGYFLWSLLDNYEWRFGYSRRLGMVRVDFPTQRRIVKMSGRWYSRFIRTGRTDIEELA